MHIFKKKFFIIPLLVAIFWATATYYPDYEIKEVPLSEVKEELTLKTVNAYKTTLYLFKYVFRQAHSLWRAIFPEKYIPATPIPSVVQHQSDEGLKDVLQAAAKREQRMFRNSPFIFELEDGPLPCIGTVDIFKPAKKEMVPAHFLRSYTVTVEKCSLFPSPEDKGFPMDYLNKGEFLKKLDVRKGWLRVWSPRLEISGWIQKKEASRAMTMGANREGVPLEELTSVTITKDDVNVRERATIASSVIFNAKQGDEYYILDHKKDWVKLWVPYLEVKGWVFGRFIEKKLLLGPRKNTKERDF